MSLAWTACCLDQIVNPWQAQSRVVVSRNRQRGEEMVRRLSPSRWKPITEALHYGTNHYQKTADSQALWEPDRRGPTPLSCGNRKRRRMRWNLLSTSSERAFVATPRNGDTPLRKADRRSRSSSTRQRVSFRCGQKTRRCAGDFEKAPCSPSRIRTPRKLRSSNYSGRRFWPGRTRCRQVR